MRPPNWKISSPIFCLALSLGLAGGCARMGSPDGGWYDERPPEVISTYPKDGETGIRSNRISIYFNEYVTIDNPTENVIISPPQIETPDIKTKGKRIVVNLKDTLRENTTYTVDFSNAIKDNNESNVMGNYTYKFSTGDAIDTLEVGGYVIDAQTLEPVEGIQVGLYMVGDSVETDSAIIARFQNEPLLRVSRTDQSGHFSIKGVKPGRYRVYALMDVDNNFMLTPNSGEQIAFWDEVISPWVFDDIRQDTTWLDSLRIKDIQRVHYDHFMPDDIMLRAFTKPQTTRGFIKLERKDPEKFTLYFSYGDTILPEIKGLNFRFEDNYILEASEKNDTLTYWLKDTMLVNTDSLEFQMTYRATDTLGVLQYQTDTLLALPKLLYEKRVKQKQDEYEEWKKKEDKKKKKGQPYDSIMPVKPMTMKMDSKSSLDPNRNITIEFAYPVATVDTAKIHLYIERDSLWYNAAWELRQKPNANLRTMEFMAEWLPESQYSFELDSAAFVDIYGFASEKEKMGIKVKGLDEYGTFKIDMPTMAGKSLIVQLLESGEKLAAEQNTTDGSAKFYYLSEKTYYLKVIVDENDNGVWDTGDYDELLQPEQVYYYHKEINCRAKWDITETWDPLAKPLNEQKPPKLAKTKSSTTKKNQAGKNQKRAEQLGIELPDYLK